MNARTAAVIVVGLAAVGCDRGEAPRFEDPIETADELAARTFPREVVEVTDGVWVAMGYGLANSILLEGDDGVVFVDTMETMEQAREVHAAFREITTKPVRAIVYTHNHADHVFGARAFAGDGAPPPVYAHEKTEALVHRIVTDLRPIISVRSARMFGSPLEDDAFVSNGIGPRLGFDETSEIGFLAPTRTFTDRLEEEIAGIRLELVHAPGETDDQIFVWLPEKRVLLPGDNLYEAFPNLYTIRGTPYRSPQSWTESLDAMRALRPAFLVPSHTRPLAGEDEIERVLTDYADAIRYVHDQTIRGINQGLTPDELATAVRLPPHLASSPYLRELYGKVSWSVRSVFAGNLGWFDGNPSTLQPLPPGEEARRMAALAGGEDRLRDAVLEASGTGDHQWVLELSDHALRLRPEDTEVRQARERALVALGEAEGNPNARHYYLTAALELRGLEIRPGNASPELLRQIPVRRFLEAMAVSLDAESALELDQKVGFVFPDTDEAFTMWVRRGVVEVDAGLADDLDIRAEVDSLVWKEILAQARSAAVAIVKDVDVTRGGKVAFIRFLALFRPQEADE